MRAAQVLTEGLGCRASHPQNQPSSSFSSWLLGLERWASLHSGSTYKSGWENSGLGAQFLYNSRICKIILRNIKEMGKEHHVWQTLNTIVLSTALEFPKMFLLIYLFV